MVLQLQIQVYLLLLLASLLSLPASSQTQKTPANVVVFIVDDMGLMDTSVPFMLDGQGKPVVHILNQWYRTPNMQQLAQSGTRFSRFYAQSVCSPTRVSLFTGQNAARHQTTTWINPLENNQGKFGPKEWNWKGLTSNQANFAADLKQMGYETIYAGKGHLGPLASEGADPLQLGFTVNIGGDAWGRPKSYYGQDHYGNHPKYKKADNSFTHNVPSLSKYHGSDTFLTEALTLEAKQAISSSVAKDKPFLLVMSHYAVHAPFNSDPRFADNYKNSSKSAKAQAFATLVEGMDHSLGEIINHLKQLNVAEDTLILFMGDNGSDAPIGKNDNIAVSQPLRGRKGTSWEGGMRAPLIVSWAKPNQNNTNQKQLAIVADQVNSQIATINDIYPTLINALNLPEPKLLDGFDLKPQLLGKINKQRSNDFLMHFPHQHRHSYFTSYHQGDWKVIFHYQPKAKQKARAQLFHLATDPSESNCLAKKQPQKLTQMLNSMAKQLQQYDAQYPKNGRQALAEFL